MQLVAAVSVTVIMIIVIMAVSIAIAMAVVVVIVASPVITMVFVLAVMMAVVMADFFAVFTGVEGSFPAAMTAPVCMLAAYGVRAVIAEARIVGAIDISAETYRTVEPGSRSEEDSAVKPCGTVVAERGATIGSVVVVAIRAKRLGAYVDRDLYFGPERCSG